MNVKQYTVRKSLAFQWPPRLLANGAHHTKDTRRPFNRNRTNKKPKLKKGRSDCALQTAKNRGVNGFRTLCLFNSYHLLLLRVFGAWSGGVVVCGFAAFCTLAAAAAAAFSGDALLGSANTLGRQLLTTAAYDLLLLLLLLLPLPAQSGLTGPVLLHC